MPDISMCSNSTECPLRFKCGRAPESGTKPSEFRQAWMAFQWNDDATDLPSCASFLGAFGGEGMCKQAGEGTNDR